MMSFKSSVAALALANLAEGFVAPTSQRPEKLQVTSHGATSAEQLAGRGGTDAVFGGLPQVAGLGLLAAGAALALGRRVSSSQQSAKKAHAVQLLAFENELGVQSPVGFWDPVGFTADGNVAAFKRRRSVELKHGRISMMAAMGYLTPEILGKFPGYLSPSADLKFSDVPNGLAAISKVPTLGWAQIVAYFGFVELKGGFDDYKTGTPGDYGWKVLTSSDPATRTYKLQSEIANSRLAMTAIMGMFFQNGITGGTGPEMWTGKAAFENELGVQPPTGFWDPAGLSSDGDKQEFYRRRCVELKHGRVSMIACIGYIVPEYFKWPGYISPTSGIKFTDIPNGVEAITKVPAVGWMQVVFFGLAMELFAAFQDPDLPPGKLSSRLVIGLTAVKDWPNNYTFGPFGIINAPSIKDPEVRKTKLNAEIANGRLAMVAIMGMMFQNGTVGTTGPEMWLGASALPKALEGTGGPLPEMVWDPIGLSKGKSEEQLLHWRAVELKHGRVAMLAVLGWFHTAAGLHPIGDIAARMRISDDPLIAATQIPLGGAFQVVFTIMCLEWLTSVPCPPPKEAPWDVLGWTPLLRVSEEDTKGCPWLVDDWKAARLQELNNGRLAMMGIVGLIAQDMYTGDFSGAPKPCFGAKICTAEGRFGEGPGYIVPYSPYEWPQLYPEMGSFLPGFFIQ